MDTNFKEEIEELNENLIAFPKAEDVFVANQAWLKEHLLPLITIDLAELTPKLKGVKLHMLNPVEPYEGYIGEQTHKYHNEFTGENYFAFRLSEDNRYEFLGNEGYFLRTAVNHWDFNSEDEKELQEDMFNAIEKSKENFAKYGCLVSLRYPEYEGKPNKTNFLDRLGGGFMYGNWTESAELPSAFKMTLPPNGTTYDEMENLPNDGIEITYNGNPFYFIAEVAGYNYCNNGADAIILMYEPVSRIVLFTFDYS